MAKVFRASWKKTQSAEDAMKLPFVIFANKIQICHTKTIPLNSKIVQLKKCEISVSTLLFLWSF